MNNEALADKFFALPIDKNGHSFNAYLIEEPPNRITLVRMLEYLKDLKQAIEELGNDFIHFFLSQICCKECGEQLKLETNGKVIRVQNPCSYPNGIGPIVFTLNIPSGKMVVANDLRKYFPITNRYILGAKINLKLTTLDYAKIGLAHCFVSNTSPSIYKRPNNLFLVGSVGDEMPRWAKQRVAQICTDLWWYSICDYDDFIKAGGTLNDRRTVVECEPGVYKFKHVYDIDKEDWPQIYTYIKRLRSPDPVV